jgi:hypothetical protein
MKLGLKDWLIRLGITSLGCSMFLAFKKIANANLIQKIVRKTTYEIYFWSRMII